MTPALLQQWIQHPEQLNRDTLYELRTWVARYPYFQSLRLLYLKNLYLLHDPDFGSELRKSVFYVADRRVLFYLLEGDRYELKSKKSTLLAAAQADAEPGIDRTLSLIDAFLATLPEEQPQSMELDYAMDYTSYLLRQEDEPQPEQPVEETPLLRGHELIEEFLQGAPFVKIEENEPEAAEEEDSSESEEFVSEERVEDGYFTETLAKIYVKQQRYDKALEIIKKLSLNYPKKNAYFADQIRFLEKLIINAKSK